VQKNQQPFFVTIVPLIAMRTDSDSWQNVGFSLLSIYSRLSYLSGAGDPTIWNSQDRKEALADEPDLNLQFNQIIRLFHV
jgi:hypothetical protein